MKGLTDAQKERALQELIEFRKRLARTTGPVTDTALGEMLGIKQPSLFKFLHRIGGMSPKTARRLATLVGKTYDELTGPKDPRPGERLYTVTYGPPRKRPKAGRDAPSEAAFSMHAVTFLANLRRMPGLEAWVVNHPTVSLTILRLAEAMLAWDALPEAQRDGSDLWWSTFLAPYCDGAPSHNAESSKSDTGKRPRFRG